MRDRETEADGSEDEKEERIVGTAVESLFYSAKELNSPQVGLEGKVSLT